MFTIKEAIGLLSFVIVTITTFQYFTLTLKGTIKPHVCTWVLWGIVMLISAAARAAADAGPGAWAAWAGAFSCASIGVLAIFKGEKDITRSDILVFLGALSAIPVWLVTNNPLYAVIIVTAIDVIAYAPTCRKSYYRPFEECVTPYFTANTLHVFSLLANLTYSLTTTLTPVVLILANIGLITLILVRRRQLRPRLAIP